MMSSMDSLDMSRQQYPQEVTEAFFIEIWSKLKRPTKLLLTCVAAKQIFDALEKACYSLWNIKAERIVSTEKGFGLVNAYAKPSELGSDRWCAMIAAYHAADSDVVVIDCGTAITIDIVNKSGQHLGGYILPGLKMMKKSLDIHTAQIPENKSRLENNMFTPANTTTGCVDAGVHLAAVKFIEAVIEQQLKRTSHLQCVLTGGDASSIAENSALEYVIMPDLVLRGLAYIAEN